MPPRKKRAVQTEQKDKNPTVANGTKPEAVGRGQEEQEATVLLGNGSTRPVTESSDLLTAARLEELEKEVRRRTYVVRREGRMDFNRRETYVVSFNPVLEEESASEDAAPETGTFFVGHANDLQEAATATPAAHQETNVMEQKPRGRKKKEKNIANPEGNDLPSEPPKKRGRKKKIVSVDQTTANIQVGSPNNDEPALVDNMKDDYFAEEKKPYEPKRKDLKTLPPKKPAKRGRKKKNELLAEQPTANLTEDSSNIDNTFVLQSIESSDSADNLLHQTDNGKTVQILEDPGKSQDNPKKKPVKRKK